LAVTSAQSRFAAPPPLDPEETPPFRPQKLIDVLLIAAILPSAFHLRDLFIQCHALEQICNALFNWEFRIAICWNILCEGFERCKTEERCTRKRTDSEPLKASCEISQSAFLQRLNLLANLRDRGTVHTRFC